MSKKETEFNEFDPLNDFNEEDVKSPLKKRLNLKKLIKRIILISILLSPLLLFVLVQNTSPDIPYGNFVQISESELFNEIDDSTFAIGSNMIEITFLESFINQIIYSSVKEQLNSDYNPLLMCQSLDCEYVIHQLNNDDEFIFGIKAIWVRFKENKVFVNAALDVQGPILIQTVVSAELNVNHNLNEVEISLNRIRLNHLPIPNIIISVAQRFIPKGISLELPDPFDSAIDIDLDDLRVVLNQRNVSDLVPYLRARIDSVEIREKGAVVRIRYGD